MLLLLPGDISLDSELASYGCITVGLRGSFPSLEPKDNMLGCSTFKRKISPITNETESMGITKNK